MIALTVQWSEGERAGLFRWIVPASIALHVVVFAWLPSARREPVALPPPLVIEVAEPPPAPPPPQRAADPSPEPAPQPARTSAPAAAAPVNVARAPRESAAPSTPASDAPIDFTSTVFSNDGPGLAMGGAASRVTEPSAVAPPRIVRPASPAPPRVVPPSSLARRPRAPGLDTELERQYPIEARRSGISGSAVLRVRILPDGRVGEVHVVSESWTGFGPACERTVRAARWEPPIDREGTPVATEITYTCRFEVRS
ncbi:MAG TPA: energy transducer TonB [Labilithrix sp.]|nr:energy transducer TonB [Labilithrix sp.]